MSSKRKRRRKKKKAKETLVYDDEEKKIKNYCCSYFYCQCVLFSQERIFLSDNYLLYIMSDSSSS